jgi:hypothetical protein
MTERLVKDKSLFSSFQNICQHNMATSYHPNSAIKQSVLIMSELAKWGVFGKSILSEDYAI